MTPPEIEELAKLVTRFVANIPVKKVPNMPPIP
jgi:hypothetical protein